MARDYSKGKIYKIINTQDDKEYVGATIKTYLSERMHGHRNDARKEQKRTSVLYRRMREIGIDKFSIVLLENYPCGSKDELHAREQHWMDQLQPVLNQVGAVEDKERRATRRANNMVQWKHANADRLSEVHHCGCGGRYKLPSRTVHFKTLMHIAWEKAQPPAPDPDMDAYIDSLLE